MLSKGLFRKTSALSAEDIDSIRHVLNGRQPFSLYFNSAIEDLALGVDNRWFYLNGNHGIAMAIEFDDICVFSIIGEVSHDVLEAMVAYPKKSEFHVLPQYAEQIAIMSGSRLFRKAELRYYGLEEPSPFEVGELESKGLDLRLLTPDDLETLQKFYSENYKLTIFSAWMLERPFVGLFLDGQLVSIGGSVVIDKAGHAANIGNFFTTEQFRGRGFSKLVVKSLINLLLKKGILHFSLGTASDNQPACKVYEAAGFSVMEKRIELYLNATNFEA